MCIKVIVFVLLNSSLAMGFVATWFDELTPLYPDSQVADGEREASLHVPLGSPAGVHLLVKGLPRGAAIKLEDVPGGTWSQLIDVPVEENTGLDSRTEIYTGKTNPHVIRRAPFRVYEAILPLMDQTAEADDSGCIALRLTITSDKAFNMEVPIVHGDQKIHLKLSHTPHRVTLPTVSQQKFHYTNWFSLENIATFHKVKIWSEAWWKLLDQYAGMMAQGRQNTVWIPLSAVFSLGEQGEPVLNRERFQRYTQIFLKHGFHSFEGGHLAARKGGSWSTRTLVTTLGKHDVASEKGKAETAAICRQLNAEIIRNKWQKQWFQHIADEPTAPLTESYQSVAEVIRREMPAIPILDATMAQSFAKAIDVWCPQIQEYQAHRRFYDGQRAKGDRIWTYVCLVPGGPWLNRLLDQERLRPVLFGWAGAHYQLDGFLHWGLNHYRKGTDPFKQSVVPHSKDNPKNKLPAGDSHVIYPGVYGPLSSIRFEAHRIGMEDHAMLEMLRLKDRKKMQTLIGKVLQSYDSYTSSVPLYRATRLELLKAVESQ